MFNEGYSFPHPVLGNDDDLSGEFDMTLEIKRTEERKIVFDNINVSITNPYIARLVKEGKAACYLRIYCSSTLKTWMAELSTSYSIHEDDLANSAELQAFVITQKEIPDFSDSSFNKEYGTQSFSLGSREVIATSGKTTVTIPKTNEKLGLGNIFQFNALKDQAPISFEVEHDKIHINYPVTPSGEHPPNMLFKSRPWTAFNIFIVPALAEALRYIHEYPEEASKWE